MAKMTAAQLRRQAAGIFVDDEALIDALEGLQPAVFRRVMKSATNKAMQPVIKDMRKEIKAKHTESGLLAKSLGKKSKLYTKGGVSVTLVGPRDGFRKLVAVPAFPGRIHGNRANRTRGMIRNPVFYMHLLDIPSRTANRGRKIAPGGTRRKPKTVNARVRWRGTNIKARTLANNRAQVMRLISQESGVGVVREWNKLAQKTRQAAK